MKNDVTHYKNTLEKERGVVIGELQGIGVVKNTKNQDDWQAVPSDMDILRADQNEVADQIGSYENNNGVVNTLEQRLMEIDQALEKISTNSYGICEVCNQEIEEDRLTANPAAKTCKAHMN